MPPVEWATTTPWRTSKWQSAVAEAAPQVDDRLAVPVHRAGGAQLATLGEVVRKRLPDRLEP
jgi:hypothetical protein